MKRGNKLVKGKNGLRSYEFEKVQKDKREYHYEPGSTGWTQHIIGMFYTKSCLYCLKKFEARRVDTAFCCQGCQKAHLRLRKNEELNQKGYSN